MKKIVIKLLALAFLATPFISQAKSENSMEVEVRAFLKGEGDEQSLWYFITFTNRSEEEQKILTDPEGPSMYRGFDGLHLNVFFSAKTIRNDKVLIPSIIPYEPVILRKGESTGISGYIELDSDIGGTLENINEGDKISIQYFVLDQWAERFDLWNQMDKTVTTIGKIPSSEPGEDTVFLRGAATGYSVEVSINGREHGPFSKPILLETKTTLDENKNTIVLIVQPIPAERQGSVSLTLQREPLDTMFPDILFEWRPSAEEQIVGEHRFTFQGDKSQIAALEEKGISATGAEDPKALGEALARVIKTEDYAGFLKLVHPKLLDAYKETSILPYHWSNILRNMQLREEGPDPEVTVSVPIPKQRSHPSENQYSPVKASGRLEIAEGPTEYIAEKNGSWFLVIYVREKWEGVLEPQK